MTTKDTTTRRAFLGLGAVLAFGAAIPLAVGHSPTRTLPPATDADLRARLAAILNRPLAAQVHAGSNKVCQCADCDAARLAPFTCVACGSRGEPIVFPCDCGDQYDETIAFNASMIRSPDLTSAKRKSLRAWQRKLLRAGRPGLCPPGDVRCAHLARNCPVCGVSEGGDATEAFNLVDIEGIGPASLIRDLRAALTL